MAQEALDEPSGEQPRRSNPPSSITWLAYAKQRVVAPFRLVGRALWDDEFALAIKRLIQGWSILSLAYAGEAGILFICRITLDVHNESVLTLLGYIESGSALSAATLFLIHAISVARDFTLFVLRK